MNPVQLDDYQDKMIKTISGESNLFAAQLREQSHPVFSPPRPLEGCHSRVQPGRRAVSWSDRDRGPTHPAGHEEPGKLHNKSVFKRETDDTNLDQDLFSQRTDPSRVNCLWSEPCEARGCSEGYRRTDIPQGQEFPNDCPEAQPEKGLTFKITDTPHDTCPPQSGPRLFPEYRLRTAHPHVPLRGNALEGQHVGKPRPGSALLELQDSYSRSDAHKRLHESLTGNAADLRDNAHSGRRHKFFGFNSYYFHN
ncbi:sperm-associated microtubule inner protein 4-like [Amia ocellicauda]|uniref:sperm-associated microtubule inner protein 4-like n=1 Tax=Amia ocellicauda TaxID=2972642 RepID=UPI00346433AE